MQLWNDYEGKTLAGTFPIETLLFTEGRNACFATRDRAGRPAVLRLTEALNDQQEMRKRFGAICEVGQPNLVSIEDFGDVEMEGTPLIYLVMEPTEESLAEILRERPLSLDETGEVATSLASALEALHAHGLVHGKVEPASVVAVGQVVKLRSDCARPAPQGEAGEQAQAADVFGLADVLNRCLTQLPLQEASDALALPEPYASIVRNVLRGSWGLEQVAGELRRSVRTTPAPQMAAPLNDTPQPVVAAPPAVASTVGSTAAANGGRKSVRVDPGSESQLPLVYVVEPEEEEDSAAAQTAGGQWRKPIATEGGRSPLLWVAGAVGVCLLLWLVWHLSASKPGATVAHTGAVPAATTTRGAQAALTPAPSPVGAPKSAAAAPAADGPANAHPGSALATSPVPSPAPGQVWRVVGYTYNVEAQARAKARWISERHPDLHPEVFSRTGHAPYLVTLGGAMTRQQAATMLQHARSRGLARDVYMQNYSH